MSLATLTIVSYYIGPSNIMHTKAPRPDKTFKFSSKPSRWKSTGQKPMGFPYSKLYYYVFVIVIIAVEDVIEQFFMFRRKK